MSPSDEQPNGAEQPVAYDAEGRPLYLHPAEPVQTQQSLVGRSQAVEQAAVKTADGIAVLVNTTDCVGFGSVRTYSRIGERCGSCVLKSLPTA